MTKNVQIIEFRIGKGKTSKAYDVEEWDRKYVELTVRLPEQYKEEDFYEALIRAEQIIDDCLEKPETPSPIPQLDIAEINDLPWKKRNKEPAKPGEFAWLFGPTSRDGTEAGAEKLVNAIKTTKDGKLILGDMEYSLVKEDAFIQRKPVKSS